MIVTIVLMFDDLCVTPDRREARLFRLGQELCAGLAIVLKTVKEKDIMFLPQSFPEGAVVSRPYCCVLELPGGLRTYVSAEVARGIKFELCALLVKHGISSEDNLDQRLGLSFKFSPLEDFHC